MGEGQARGAGVVGSVLVGLVVAALGTGSPPSTEETVKPSTPAERLPLLGAAVDVGVPDGAGVSVVVRPWRFLRFEAGGLHNSAAPGLRGGATWVVLPGWMSPTLTLEAGHYFPGNGNWLAQKVMQNPGFSSAFLDSVQYNFYNAHAGLELGSPRRFTFFLHAGVSHVDLRDNSFNQGLQQNTDRTWTSGPATASLNALSAKLGFLLYVG